MLKANNLTKIIKNKTLVNDVSLNALQGNITALLGPNGAGKTTTFYMLVGLITPSSGSVFLNDKNITSLSLEQRSSLGLSYLPQEHSTFESLTVYDNIWGFASNRKDLKRAQQKSLTNDIINQFGLTKVQKSLSKKLSGGERRKLEIARTLCFNPSYLLLDEPFAGVDPKSIQDLKKILFQLKSQGIGLIITDHNVYETLDIVDDGYILHEGKLLTAGSKEEILNHSDVKRLYLGENFTVRST